ncbi:MAG: DUF6179 domain-containing protein [Erysipelotrichaceae bacterium]
MNIEKVLNNPDNKEELLILLKNRIKKFKNRYDSSIPVSKAEALLESIIYILSLNDEESSITKMYENGLIINDYYLKESYKIYERLLNDMFINDNRYYLSTLNDGIKAFFILYNRYFFPENYHITVDYPLMITRFNLKGAHFIKNYLFCAETENIFLNRFLGEDVHRLLFNNDENYEDMPINLCETVFINWLFDFKSSSEITEIYKEMTEEQFKANLHNKINSSVLTLREKIYFNHYLESNIYKIHEMIRLNTLDTVIYHETEEKIDIEFYDYERLLDFEYENRLDRLRYDKDYAVLKDIDSIFDLADLLMEAIDDINEMLKALNFINEDKFIGLLLYFRNYDSLFTEALYLRLEDLEETKRNKIQKMLDNIKDGQDY